MPGCTFEPRMQKWILIAWQVAKTIASPHCWAFKLKLKKADETNFNVKKEEDLGVHQVCRSEVWDCDEQMRDCRTVKELCVERALLLLFSYFWPGAEDLAGVPRAQQHKVCKFSFLPGDQETSPGCVREQRCIGAHHSQQWLCLVPFLRDVGEMAPSPAQTSSRRLCLQKGASYQGKEEKEGV